MDRFMNIKEKLLAWAKEDEGITLDLFCRLASQTAEMRGYKYPKEAENYTKNLLEEAR